MSKYVYYKPSGDMTTIPALLEHVYEDNSTRVTFGEHINSFYASYAQRALLVPAELMPEVYETVTGDMMFRLNSSRIYVDLIPVRLLPALRLQICEVRGKEYAYFDINKVKYDRLGESQKVGKTIRVLCEIVDAE